MDTTPTISRGGFLRAAGAAAAAAALPVPVRAAPVGRGPDLIRLGMMLQGGSAAELQARAEAIAAVGFDTVQLTFFFSPTVDDIEAMARTLDRLKLKTAAFGTYFNLFRPDDTGFMRSSLATLR